MRTFRLRTGLIAGGAVLAAGGAAALYARDAAPPGCDSDQVLRQVNAILRVTLHLDGVFVNSIETVSGGWFDTQVECAAQVASIRGNVNASDLPWREIRYRIDRPEASGPPAVTLRVEGRVPLAKPAASVFARFRDRWF